jgi:hypothetical protein
LGVLLSICLGHQVKIPELQSLAAEHKHNDGRRLNNQIENNRRTEKPIIMYSVPISESATFKTSKYDFPAEGLLNRSVGFSANSMAWTRIRRETYANIDAPNATITSPARSGGMYRAKTRVTNPSISEFLTMLAKMALHAISSLFKSL